MYAFLFYVCLLQLCFLTSHLTASIVSLEYQPQGLTFTWPPHPDTYQDGAETETGNDRRLQGDRSSWKRDKCQKSGDWQGECMGYPQSWKQDKQFVG